MDLITLFGNHPFDLDESESELVGRYLVEDNNEGFVIIDWDASCNVARIRSILRNLL